MYSIDNKNMGFARSHRKDSDMFGLPLTNMWP